MAGHFVGFRLLENAQATIVGDGSISHIPISQQPLIVFDQGRERMEFKDTARWGGQSPTVCIYPLANVGQYVLASDGWVAEVDNGDFVTALLATNDGHHHWPLDDSGRISQLTLSGWYCIGPAPRAAPRASRWGRACSFRRCRAPQLPPASLLARLTRRRCWAGRSEQPQAHRVSALTEARPTRRAHSRSRCRPACRRPR